MPKMQQLLVEMVVVFIVIDGGCRSTQYRQSQKQILSEIIEEKMICIFVSLLCMKTFGLYTILIDNNYFRSIHDKNIELKHYKKRKRKKQNTQHQQSNYFFFRLHRWIFPVR